MCHGRCHDGKYGGSLQSPDDAASVSIAARQRRPEHLLDARGAGRQHHQAVEARAQPDGRRHVRQRGEEVLVDRDSARRRRAASRPSRPRGGGAARRDRSARRRRWRARRRRHKARSARRRADRAARAAPAPPSWPGTRSSSVARPLPSFGSMRSTSTRLKMSAQVSSSATRDAGALGRGGKRVAVVARRRGWRAGRCRRGGSKASATVSRSGGANGSAVTPRQDTKRVVPRPRRRAQQRGAVLHQPLRRARSARYHSSMVNSGWCSAPRSRLRNTGANVKIRVSPAASSFLQANSGEVCR